MDLAVIVPFFDEAEYLPRLLETLADQTRPPDLLLLVDDGSTDASAEIADAFAVRHDYARLLKLPPRPPTPDRLATASEWRAFTRGVAEFDRRYDLMAKLDADLALTPAVFEHLERQFAAEPCLGVAGSYLSEVQLDGRLRRHRCPAGNVEGATKFYRRECYEQIAPIPAILGWDTIDEARARIRGWRTQTFAMPDGDPIHLRRAWARSGILRGYRRAGAAAHGYGSHPATVLASAAVRLRDRPPVLGGLSYLAGFASARLRRSPQAEPELRAFVRREQLRRLRDLAGDTMGRRR